MVKPPVSKRKRKDHYDSDEDRISVSPKIKKEPGLYVTTDVTRPAPLLRRHIMLTFEEEEEGTRVSWPITEDVIRQIPQYRKKLEAILTDPQTSRSLEIVDQKPRDEDIMRLLIDYLTFGDVKSLIADQWDLLDLGGLCIDLGLEEGRVIEVTRHIKLRADNLLSFARYCYRDGRTSSLADHAIEQAVVLHLSKLEDAGIADEILEVGGPLKGLLNKAYRKFFRDYRKAERAHGSTVEL